MRSEDSAVGSMFASMVGFAAAEGGSLDLGAGGGMEKELDREDWRWCVSLISESD